jgi:hypothetical protein
MSRRRQPVDPPALLLTVVGTVGGVTASTQGEWLWAAVIFLGSIVAEVLVVLARRRRARRRGHDALGSRDREVSLTGPLGSESGSRTPAVRGLQRRVARRRIRNEVGTGPWYRVCLVLLTVALAYVLARAVTADEPSTVSIVIRAIGLAVCSSWLVESFTKGRRRHRHDPVRRDAAGG